MAKTAPGSSRECPSRAITDAPRMASRRHLEQALTADVAPGHQDLQVVAAARDSTVAHIRTPLKELAEALGEGAFWQVHRGYMVAVKRIAAVTREDDGAMWLTLRQHDARLPVSQRFQYRFKGM